MGVPIVSMTHIPKRGGNGMMEAAKDKTDVLSYNTPDRQCVKLCIIYSHLNRE